MNESTENETLKSNVIEVQFTSRDEVVSNDIAHPASKHYIDNLDDDPLYDLLHEFDDVLDDDEEDEQDDFIFHLLEAKDVKLEMSQKATEMAMQVLEQVNRLKDDVQRMKFYLDEMNIDD